MKLLICHQCGDVFNLGFTLKSCSCGETKGKYLNSREAVVNGKGTSMAIGNGSLIQAQIRIHPFHEEKDREGYQEYGKVMCWLRPHEGPGNPHTTVVPDLGEEQP